MPKEKRNAILLSGFCRDFESTVFDFKKNLQNQENVDVFICFWDQVGNKTLTKHPDIVKSNGDELVIKNYSRETIDLERIQQVYQPSDIRIFNLDQINELIAPFSDIIEKSDMNMKGLKFSYHISRTMLMFYMIGKTYELMAEYGERNNIEYKNIIRARTDFVQGGYYPKVDWSRDLSSSLVEVGAWNWSGHGVYQINDHFAFGNKKAMGVYCSFFKNIVTSIEEIKTNSYGSTIFENDQPIATKAWSPEHMLSIYLSKMGMKWKRVQEIR